MDRKEGKCESCGVAIPARGNESWKVYCHQCGMREAMKLVDAKKARKPIKH